MSTLAPEGANIFICGQYKKYILKSYKTNTFKAIDFYLLVICNPEGTKR